jgi:hypothetical protein
MQLSFHSRTAAESHPFFHLSGCMKPHQSPISADIWGPHAWSSYRSNAAGEADPLVNTHSLYRSLAKVESERQGAYRELLRMPLAEERLDEIRERTNKGWALGCERFQSKIERLAERRASPLPKGRPKKTLIE